MIEIELKYELKNKIFIDKEITSKNRIEDIYYDTSDYKLLKNGNFLRVRNDKKIDFKLSANDKSHLFCKETSYSLEDKNISKIKEVLDNLGVNIKLDKISDLFKELKVLAPIKKERISYKLADNVILVLDKVEDLGEYLEIEYDLDKEALTLEDSKYYKNYLIDMLKKNGLFNKEMIEVHIGYVELYLKKYNIDAYYLGMYQEQ